MPVRVFRIPDEPILVASFDRVITSDILHQMYDLSAKLIAADDEVLYRITDFRHVTTSPLEVLQIYYASQSERVGSTSDSRIRPVLLGDNQWSRMASDMLWEYAKMELPIFDSMSEAIAHIRLLMQYRKRGTASAT